MALMCARCSRSNPDDATYCYWDGNLLAPHAQASRVSPGQMPFPRPFVLPSGQACQNFDQLALACQQNWAACVELLRTGMLEKFLAGMGRIDLALAAREAANYPDRDRGLDQFLARLPSQTLKPPQVQAEPPAITIAHAEIGRDVTVTLHLHNAGGRLLYGSVVSDVPWVALGDKPGHSQKLFQTADGVTLPIQIRGELLRASARPLQARLLIDTNGGQASVTVRAHVPVKPFPIGVLAGASSPREIAVKAKQSPKEAAALFEQGEVQKWYQQNGWKYPVQGKPASGVAAVQQFFEALGLVKPPVVQISERAVYLSGSIGQRLEHSFLVFTDEKRHLYAHAVSDQRWLRVSTVPLAGNRAKVTLQAVIPSFGAGILSGNITIAANGNQRFVVPVQVTVVGGALASAVRETAIPVAQLAEPIPVVAAAPVIVPKPTPSPAVLPSAVPVVLAEPMTAVAEVIQPAPATPYGSPTGPGLSATAPDTYPSGSSRPLVTVRRTAGMPAVLHTVPLAFLAVALLGILAKDLFLGVDNNSTGPANVVIEGDDKDGGRVAQPPPVPVDPNPRLYYLYDDFKRFGLTVAETGKLLTYHNRGSTNSTVVRIDNTFAREFGSTFGGTGRWITTQAHPNPPPPNVKTDFRTKNVWESRDHVRVTQVVDIVPSEQPVAVNGEMKRVLDTCLVAYLIENKDTRPHHVGVRFQLDTLIGRNDGVPFTVPGEGLVTTFADYAPPAKPVPEFVQALEVPDLNNPGTVAHLTLNVGDGLERPSRVSLTLWPGYKLGGNHFTTWDIPVEPINTNVGSNAADSCVVLYWEDRLLQPGAKRAVGFAYGLSQVTADSSGGGPSTLGLNVAGSFDPGKSFLVTAYVGNPQPEQSIQLALPEGLHLTEGQLQQPVPPAKADNRSVVTWHVKVGRTGRFPIEVRLSSGAVQRRTVTITRPDAKRPNIDTIFK